MTDLANNLKEKQVDTSSCSSGGWHLKLFSKSVLKQAKLRNLTKDLGPTEGLRCLDLGSDNGVISYYLRERGGDWASADLTKQAVDSITSLVGSDVSLVDGKTLPYPNESFDKVIIVDMLEHLEDDRLLINEILRILKVNGSLIINTPNRKPLSFLRLFRELIGQGDQEHGHVRAGYSLAQTKELLEGHAEIEKFWTYSRFFSELIDTLIVLAYRILSSLKSQANSVDDEEHSKGLVVTSDDMKKFEKSFKLYSAIYPIVWLVSRLDYLIAFLPGYMRLTVAKKTK